MNQKFIDAGLENVVIKICERYPHLTALSNAANVNHFLSNVSRLQMVSGVSLLDYDRLLKIR